MKGVLFALETETANAIGYVSFALVLIVFIVCSAWVLVRWGPPISWWPPKWESRAQSDEEGK